jgi:prevent-host-death family protein
MVKAMKQLNITEAKAQFSQLVTNAARGESTVIARGGRPVAKIVPFDGISSKIKFGTYKRELDVPGDFDAPDQDIIDMFENRPIAPPKRKK